jgi:hypothetical protein
MQTFSQFALPGTIVASALGAVVLCVVLLLYGFKNEPDDERAPMRRFLLIRLGHALAAASFALALMLGTVALLEQRRVAAASDDEMRGLATRISDLERRLARTESRMTEGPVAPTATMTPVGAASRVTAAATSDMMAASASTPVVATTSGSAAVTASPLAVETHRPAAVLPPRQRKVAVTPRPASPSDDLAAKVREGWDALKRGFREAGRDIRGGFADQGR